MTKNNQRQFDVIQNDLREILNSPYIKQDEVNRVSQSFNSIIENSLESLDYIDQILSSDSLKMTDAERATVLKEKELESKEMVAEIESKTKRYKEIIAFRELQAKINESRNNLLINTMILSIGLEYVDAVFMTIKSSEFSQFTITGMKALAILFFLINIFKKYNEGVANNEGYTWGLTPSKLAKNFAVIILVIFSTQVLGVFDSILVAIETQYRDTAPALLPLQLQDIDLEQEVGAIEAAKKALAMLYEALVTPLYGLKVLSFIITMFLWLLDLFIYPLFLAERFFLLGIMQAFFPLVISLAVFEKFRTWHTTFLNFMLECIC